jgi:hypothetical protein
LRAAADERTYAAARFGENALTDSISGTVQLDGAAIGRLVGDFHNYDGLVAALRDRAASVGLSFSQIDELSLLGESACAKYLSDLRVKNLALKSFFAISETLGIRAIFVEDEKLLAQVKPHWQHRDDGKAHRAGRAAKRLGPVTLRRVLPPVAAEMGRRGGVKRRELPAETRRALAQAAARARWQGRRS